MAVTKIQLNGTQFTAGDVQETRVKIGTAIQAANGARRWAHRADKRGWSISWPTATLAELTSIRTIAALTATFTFIDENAASYTVMCQDSPLKSSVAALTIESGAQAIRYSVTLELVEA